MKVNASEAVGDGKAELFVDGSWMLDIPAGCTLTVHALRDLSTGKYLPSGTYGKDGKFVRNKSRRKYADATREIANEKNVEFVDMTELTCQILETLDKTPGEDLYVGDTMKNDKKVFDTCHPSKAGAKRFGEAFIKDAADRKLEIASIFK